MIRKEIEKRSTRKGIASERTHVYTVCAISITASSAANCIPGARARNDKNPLFLNRNRTTNVLECVRLGPSRNIFIMCQKKCNLLFRSGCGQFSLEKDFPQHTLFRLLYRNVSSPGNLIYGNILTLVLSKIRNRF